MHHDQTFRWVLMVGLLILVPIAATYRIRSQATGEKLDRRQEGLFVMVALRLVGIVGIVGLAAYMVNPVWMAWASVPLPIALRWFGVGLGVIGGGLWIWTFHTLGKNLTDTVVTRKDHTLVTSGPYRWVRHPFYVCIILCVLANSLVTANTFIFVTGVLLLVLIYVRTQKEEENLLARFGNEYQKYMQSTGRFWPRFGNR